MLMKDVYFPHQRKGTSNSASLSKDLESPLENKAPQIKLDLFTRRRNDVGVSSKQVMYNSSDLSPPMATALSSPIMVCWGYSSFKDKTKCARLSLKFI